MDNPSIAKYFLRGDALLSFARKECGFGPVEKSKDYNDYLKEAALRQVKSQALKRLVVASRRLTP